MKARVGDWLLVHACTLLVFGHLVESLPRDTAVGIPTVVVVACITTIAGITWVMRSSSASALGVHVLAFVVSTLTLVLVVAGVGSTLGATHREDLKQIGPFVASFLVVPLAVALWTRHPNAQFERTASETRRLRMAALVHGVGVGVFLARYPLYELTEMPELIQLAQVELIVVYPPLVYLRAALRWLRRKRS